MYPEVLNRWRNKWTHHNRTILILCPFLETTIPNDILFQWCNTWGANWHQSMTLRTPELQRHSLTLDHERLNRMLLLWAVLVGSVTIINVLWSSVALASNIDTAIRACKEEKGDVLQNRTHMEMVKESLNEGYCDISGRVGELNLIGGYFELSDLLITKSSLFVIRWDGRHQDICI